MADMKRPKPKIKVPFRHNTAKALRKARRTRAALREIRLKREGVK
jgi:hypothetical protein